MQKREIQTYKIGLRFANTDLNYETFLENNKYWCCGHLNSVYILLGHPGLAKSARQPTTYFLLVPTNAL